MIVSSPLGKYGSVIAACIALILICAYVFANLCQAWLKIPLESLDRLGFLASLAVGAVFGSQATINGVKGPIDSAHSRIDKLEVGSGIPTHGAYPNVPGEPPSVEGNMAGNVAQGHHD